MKNRGGLVFPSSDVVKIMIAGDDLRNPKVSSCKNLKGKIRHSVLSELRIINVFTVLNNNHFENVLFFIHCRFD